ncbi:MAG: hypothetical protein QOF41_2351 [Methylobacteriaceae bacterium]|nr:hypothetical protein [Methylobacteriaceae bacterium]
MPAANPIEVAINFDAISAIMAVGANRASSFMFLGLRSAEDETIRSVRLDGAYTYQFMPEPLSAEQSKEVRGNFLKWIIGNGLRELDQHFVRALDEAYTLYVLINAGSTIRMGDLTEQLRPFTNKTNAGDKLETIANAFGANATLLPHIRSLAAARNALTHNAGMVSPRHAFGGTALKVRWRGLDISVGDQTFGETFEPIFVTAGQEITLAADDREKIFQIGAEIAFSPHELHEICLTYIIQIDEVKLRAVDFARTKGLPVTIIPAASALPAS